MEIDVLTYKVIGCAYTVHNILGCGFLEKVYENALRLELKRHGIAVQQQPKLPVFYEGDQVGLYFPDLLIEENLVVEIKAAIGLAPEHEIKLVHYLAATGIDTGLLINFGDSVQVRRKLRSVRP